MKVNRRGWSMLFLGGLAAGLLGCGEDEVVIKGSAARSRLKNAEEREVRERVAARKKKGRPGR